MRNRWRNNFIFLGSKITADGVCSHEIKRCLLLGRKAVTNLKSILKSRHYFADKVPSSQSYGFSSSHVWMWELDHKESWVPKNWCFWTVVLEKTLESPLDCKQIQPVNPKGNQSWIFIGRTDAEAEVPILWPPDENWLIGKDPDTGKHWRQEENGTDSLEKTLILGNIEGRRRMGRQRMRQLNGITNSMDESEQAPGVVMDREDWSIAVYGVAKSRTWLRGWTELNWGRTTLGRRESQWKGYEWGAYHAFLRNNSRPLWLK